MEYNPATNNSPIYKTLKGIIKEDVTIFADFNRLNEKLNNSNLSTKDKAILSLVFSTTSVAQHIQNSSVKFTVVDANNLIQEIMRKSGLNYDTAFHVVVDIMYACGVNIPVECTDIATNSEEVKDTKKFLPKEEVNKLTTEADKILLQLLNNKEVSEADCNYLVDTINTLCDAGVSHGFYLRGICYFYGFANTTKNEKLAKENMHKATERGDYFAARFLGDLYYGRTNVDPYAFSKAYKYYTYLGAAPTTSKQRTRMEDIMDQAKANIDTLIFSAVLVALTIVFLVMFSAGIFSGASRLVVGIILAVLSLALGGAGGYYYYKTKYNGFKFILILQYVIWAIYALILALA